MTPRAHRGRTWIEAFALGALAAAPILPYLSRLAARGVPRFTVEGDYAGLELATRFALSGRTLLGPYSRFHFNHPGPAYFFFLAPVYELGGEKTTGIFAGAALINAAAVITMVAAARLLGSRAHGVGAAAVAIAWFAAFGNTTALPWNPLAVALPLLAFFVLASLFAAGRSQAAPFAVALGALVAETHLATVPTTSAIAIAAAVSFVLGRRRRREPVARAERAWLFAAAGVLVLMLLPPLVEQVTAAEGNLTKLARFFAGRSEPPKPLGEALRAWMTATAWLPERVADATLLREGAPRMMASEPIAEAPPAQAPYLAAAWLAAIAASAAVAWRRRDAVSLALLSTSALSTLASTVALRAVVGPMFHYLLFWTCACTAVGWIGAASVVASLARGRLRHAVSAALVAGAVFATSLEARWLENPYYAERTRPRDDLRALYEALVARAEARGETPVIHQDGGWNIALGLLNELTRDGRDARVEPRDRWILGRQLPAPDGAARALHVYPRVPPWTLPSSPCLELVSRAASLELYVSPVPVEACPAPAP